MTRPDDPATAPDRPPAPAEAYERRCRRLLRLAYPPRFIERHGEEILGILLDLAPPGADRPDTRTVLDVLRGGVALRLRERPPLWHWLLYRGFGRRLPFRYRWWARDDIRGSFFVERSLVTWLLFVLPFTVMETYGLIVSGADNWWGFLFWVGVWYVIARAGLKGSRRKMLAKHEFNPDGTSYTPLPPPERR
ncbi:DUF5313 family protein [Planobispora siamensis]|uniref:Uncharacterized protein n=1 Tax=Planobispora siamensis TaxID=936338 RepID=A0A8J3WR53_9ACTN|nr:DUF5313 family protein [Planobispora siamensis]GIH96511.1 hypothetical protein Psi01_71410 [Planobispora siamensis]